MRKLYGLAAEASRRLPGDASLGTSLLPVTRLLERLERMGFEKMRLDDPLTRGLKVRNRSARDLLGTRCRHLGPNMSVSYTEPLKIVRGEGQ